MKDIRIALLESGENLQQELNSLIVRDREVLLCNGVAGIYVAGYVEKVYAMEGLADVSPIPDTEKNDVRNEIWKKYKAGRPVSFRNEIYLV